MLSPSFSNALTDVQYIFESYFLKYPRLFPDNKNDSKALVVELETSHIFFVQ